MRNGKCVSGRIKLLYYFDDIQRHLGGTYVGTEQPLCKQEPYRGRNPTDALNVTVG